MGTANIGAGGRARAPRRSPSGEMFAALGIEELEEVLLTLVTESGTLAEEIA